MRGLYIYTHGFPDEHGLSSTARLSWLQLNLLARRMEMDLLAVIPLNQTHNPPSPALAALCRNILSFPLPSTKTGGILSVLSGLALFRPPSISLKTSSKMKRFLRTAIHEKKYDLIVVQSTDGLIHLTPDLLQQPDAPALCIATEEVQWTAWRGFSLWQCRSIGFQQALQSVFWRWMKSFERSRYRPARLVLCLSEREADAVRQLDPSIPTSLIPLPVEAPTVSSETKPDSNEILFTGNYHHPPNRLAALELSERILPLVRKVIPDARLRLAGKGAASLSFLTKGETELDDTVPSLIPLYRKAAVVAGPIRTGEGVRGKFLEALACGCPVVTTALGASGIQAGEEQGLLICETPIAFAATIVRLLQDPSRRSRLGQAGAEAIRRHHSPSAFAHVFTMALDRLVGPKGVIA